jgi:hypothetical protein
MSFVLNDHQSSFLSLDRVSKRNPSAAFATGNAKLPVTGAVSTKNLRTSKTSQARSESVHSKFVICGEIV